MAVLLAMECWWCGLATAKKFHEHGFWFCKQECAAQWRAFCEEENRQLDYLDVLCSINHAESSST